MRKFPIICLLIPMLYALISCGQSSKEKEMSKQIDSLQNVSALNQMRYDDLQGYLTVLAETLDSISIEENELIVSFSNPEKVGYNRTRMKENVSHVREILAGHREKIAELEEKLANDNGQLKHLKTIIASLRDQIDAKDKELEQLRADLDNSRNDIRTLATRVQEISAENDAKDATIQDQQEMIQKQNEKINTAYVRIGKKKDLEQAGLLKNGGFLRKKKVDYSNMDVSQFQTVDISNFQFLELPQKYELKTEVPKNSYTIEKHGDRNILVITDPQKFWSISHFLIIQDNTK